MRDHIIKKQRRSFNGRARQIFSRLKREYFPPLSCAEEKISDSKFLRLEQKHIVGGENLFTNFDVSTLRNNRSFNNKYNFV